MYDCEICGKKTESLYVIDVEGAELSVCASCSRGKKVVGEIASQNEKNARKAPVRIVKKEQEAEEVVQGYGGKIRRAREAMNLDLKVLGEMINEKHSTLLRVEEEKMLPNLKLTAKLEKALGIKLTANVVDDEGDRPKGSAPITLGDAAFTKRKGD